MKLHRRFVFGFFFLCGLAGLTIAHATVVEPDVIQLVTPFTVTESTQVPGKTLKAGTYSIRVVDHLSDRVILQIVNAKGAEQTRFLALENSALHSTPGPLSWANGSNKTSTLRGFSFPGGTTVEFVYPKDDAVLIAKVNATRVPAIDPTSEGRVAANHLSKEDFETVTLWTLQSTSVGPADASQPAIEAVRYQSPAPAVVAQGVSTQEDMPQRARATVHAPVSHPGRNAQPSQQVAAVRTPTIRALPHTASEEPVVILLGTLALCAGLSLRYARRRANAV